MCNLGEILELEAIKSERVRNIKSIMTKLKMSFKEAIAFLEIPEDLEPCNRHGADGTFKNEDGKKYVEDTAGDFVW